MYYILVHKHYDDSLTIIPAKDDKSESFKILIDQVQKEIDEYKEDHKEDVHYKNIKTDVEINHQVLVYGNFTNKGFIYNSPYKFNICNLSLVKGILPKAQVEKKFKN